MNVCWRINECTECVFEPFSYHGWIKKVQYKYSPFKRLQHAISHTSIITWKPSENCSTYFVHPKWALLKVPVTVKLMMCERVPAVHVYIAGLFNCEVARCETADLRPCKIKKSEMWHHCKYRSCSMQCLVVSICL